MKHNTDMTPVRFSPLEFERVRGDQPSGAPQTGGGIGEGDASSSLTNLLHLLASHKWAILAFVAVVTTATVVVSRKLQPLYEATTLVRIERQSAALMGPDASEFANSDMEQIIATQLEILQSDPVLRPVAQRYDLLRREKQFQPNTPGESLALAAPTVLRRLKVTRPPNTYLVHISYSASDPVLAAHVANDIAASYIAHAFDSRDRAYSEVSDSVKSELKGLRMRMESSTGHLASLQKDLNMVDPEQGSTIQSARLQQLNQEFTSAQADRLKKEAALEAFNSSNSLAAAQASSEGAALDRALERLDAARQQFAAIRAIYGENNSEYKKATDQVDELQRQVDQMRTDAKERLTVESRQAMNRESALALLVASTKGEVDGLGSKTLQYQQLKRDAENDKKLYEDLERRTAEVGINNRYQDNIIQIIARALPAASPESPNIPLNAAIAFLSSALLGVILVIVLHSVDSTIADPEEAAATFNIDVLGQIPATRKIMSTGAIAGGEAPSKRSVEPMGRFIEGIRLLRGSVGLAHMARPIRTVLFTSAQPGEGKSTTVANLALSFAQVGKRVLLVDADLRTPTLHRDFRVSNETGLADVLAGRVGWREAMIKIHPNLYVIPAGSVSQAAPDAFAIGAPGLFENASQEFDLLFIDAPPLLGFAESHQLARIADSVIVVAQAKRTRSKAVRSTLAALNGSRANVLGLVVTHVKSKASDYGYGYGYVKNGASRDSKESIPEKKNLSIL